MARGCHTGRRRQDDVTKAECDPDIVTKAHLRHGWVQSGGAACTHLCGHDPEGRPGQGSVRRRAIAAQRAPRRAGPLCASSSKA